MHALRQGHRARSRPPVRKERTSRSDAVRHSSKVSDSSMTTEVHGAKHQTPMPWLKTSIPLAHQCIFGPDRAYLNASDRYREQFRQRFIGELTQRNQFECILDANPAHRFDLHTEPGYRTRRYDRQPDVMITAQTRPHPTDPDCYSLSVCAKSRLAEYGQLEPVAPISSDIWEEDSPIKLAALVYAHVYSTNKPKASASLSTTTTSEERERMESVLRETVQRKCAAGSPLTSTTLNSYIDDFLRAWGKPDTYISVEADRVHMVSPTYLAALILFVASDENADTLIKFDWRKDFAKANGKDEYKMAALLEAHGVNPNGQWTNRDRCAYFALVAAEHMVIGVTPEGTACELETRKE